MSEKTDIVEQVGEIVPALPTKKWTFKKVFLSIITLYFVIIILKYLGLFIWKVLNLARKYIHDLTDEHKIGEVVLWTFIGVVLGVLLNKQILWLLNWLKDLWDTNIIPWIRGIISG